MRKLYYFPSPDNNGYGNPYSMNYKDVLHAYFDVMEADNKKPNTQYDTILLFRSFQADVFLLNWVESFVYYKSLKSLWRVFVVICSFLVIKIRRKKVVWMLHNLHPHVGEDIYTKICMKWLFRNADLIIAHSEVAYNMAKEKARCKVLFTCHPINNLVADPNIHDVSKHDVFIWGQMHTYKGVAEFLEKPEVREYGLNVYMIGSCPDKEYSRRLHSYCNSNIVYEERRADFNEVAANCVNSKYVLFPYIGDCVSSSGALMDTLSLGGVPVGPNVGAFKDLAKDGMCYVYNDDKDLFKILNSNKTIDEAKRTSFFKENSWGHLAKIVYENI